MFDWKFVTCLLYLFNVLVNDLFNWVNLHAIGFLLTLVKKFFLFYALRLKLRFRRAFNNLGILLLINLLLAWCLLSGLRCAFRFQDLTLIWGLLDNLLLLPVTTLSIFVFIASIWCLLNVFSFRRILGFWFLGGALLPATLITNFWYYIYFFLEKFISSLYCRSKSSHFFLWALVIEFVIFADIPRIEECAV